MHELFMKLRYHRHMSRTILQVRDVPEPVLARLRERAATRGISLSAYIRELLAEDAAQETMNELIERVSTRTPVDVSDEEILGVIHDGRR
jgi:plasmid stability protein